MKNPARTFVDFLIFSNVYVAIPLALLTWASYLLFDAIGPNFQIVAFVYFSGLSLYSLHRLIGLDELPKKHASPRHLWAKRNYRFLQIIALVSGVFAFILFLLQSLDLQLAIGIAALVTGLYTVPFIRIGGRHWRLRDVPFLKVFIISATVTFVTVAIPYIDVQFIQEEQALVLICIERFLFILAITIPFDLRDKAFDKLSNVKTLPIVLGDNNTKLLILSCMVAFAGVAWYHYSFTLIGPSRYFLPLCLSALIGGWVAFFAEEKSSEYYYSYLLEGTMILQFGLVYAASNYLY